MLHLIDNISQAINKAIVVIIVAFLCLVAYVWIDVSLESYSFQNDLRLYVNYCDTHNIYNIPCNQRRELNYRPNRFGDEISPQNFANTKWYIETPVMRNEYAASHHGYYDCANTIPKRYTGKPEDRNNRLFGTCFVASPDYKKAYQEYSTNNPNRLDLGVFAHFLGA